MSSHAVDCKTFAATKARCMRRLSHRDSVGSPGDTDQKNIPPSLCSVCLGTLSAEPYPQTCTLGPIITLSHCSHQFHLACVEQWFNTSNQNHGLCPHCRVAYVPYVVNMSNAPSATAAATVNYDNSFPKNPDLVHKHNQAMRPAGWVWSMKEHAPLPVYISREREKYIDAFARLHMVWDGIGLDKMGKVFYSFGSDCQGIETFVTYHYQFKGMGRQHFEILARWVSEVLRVQQSRYPAIWNTIAHDIIALVATKYKSETNCNLPVALYQHAGVVAAFVTFCLYGDWTETGDAHPCGFQGGLWKHVRSLHDGAADDRNEEIARQMLRNVISQCSDHLIVPQDRLAILEEGVLAEKPPTLRMGLKRTTERPRP